MKKVSIFILFFFTLNCSINKVSNTHGIRLIKNNYDKIIIAKTNKNDVRKIIGPPSSKSKFNDTWIYIERKKTNQSLLKLGKKVISKNNIIIVEFDSKGMVLNKKFLDLNDMNDIKILEKTTAKDFQQNNKVYNLLSTLREKLNAPARNRKK